MPMKKGPECETPPAPVKCETGATPTKGEKAKSPMKAETGKPKSPPPSTVKEFLPYLTAYRSQYEDSTVEDDDDKSTVASDSDAKEKTEEEEESSDEEEEGEHWGWTAARYCGMGLITLAILFDEME